MQGIPERGRKMKKIALITTILILFISPSFLPAQNTADEMYIKAVTTPDPAQRVKLLKDYLNKYGDKGTKYENHVYAQLCLTPYQGKSPKETIDYGEKAIALGGLDDLTTCQLYIALSGLYSNLGQNLDKARDYAFQVVKISKANKNKESATESPQQWNQFIGAGYYAHAQALEKAKDLKGAVDSYINSFQILKNKQIANDLKKVGKSLYDFKFYNEAEMAFRIACTALGDFASCTFYAKTLYRNGKKDEALKYFKQAYAKQKSGEIAYNIGIILASKAEKDPSFQEEAIKYLLDASFLSPKNSEKAMSLAERLFFTGNSKVKFNEKVKELQEKTQNLENLTEEFNQNFGEKVEEDLDEKEKKEMENLLSKIKAEEAAIKKLEAEQKAFLAEFQKLIDQTKKRLGIG
jgi:tetratricopeptide (TPR) repeat protein